MVSGRQVGAISEPGSDRGLWSVQFSPDGTMLATAGDDGIVRVWDARTGRLLTSMTEPDGYSTYDAEFNATGTELVSASSDGSARIWSTELAGPVSTLERIARGRLSRGFTPSERAT